MCVNCGVPFEVEAVLCALCSVLPFLFFLLSLFGVSKFLQTDEALFEVQCMPGFALSSETLDETFSFSLKFSGLSLLACWYIWFWSLGRSYFYRKLKDLSLRCTLR